PRRGLRRSQPQLTMMPTEETPRPERGSVLAPERTSPAASEVVHDAWASEVSVVMPCLNEAETLQVCIEKALRAFEELGVDGEVVVADNGSTDGSQEIAIAAGARVVPVPTPG